MVPVPSPQPHGSEWCAPTGRPWWRRGVPRSACSVPWASGHGTWHGGQPVSACVFVTSVQPLLFVARTVAAAWWRMAVRCTRTLGCVCVCVCVCVFDQVLLGVTQEHSCMLHALDLTQFCGGAVPIQRRHVRTALQFFSKIPFDALRSCPEVTTACVAAQFSFPSPNHAVDFVSVLTHVSTLCHGHGKRSLWRWDGTVEGGCMV